MCFSSGAKRVLKPSGWRAASRGVLPNWRGSTSFRGVACFETRDRLSICKDCKSGPGGAGMMCSAFPGARPSPRGQVLVSGLQVTVTPTANANNFTCGPTTFLSGLMMLLVLAGSHLRPGMCARGTGSLNVYERLRGLRPRFLPTPFILRPPAQTNNLNIFYNSDIYFQVNI